MLEAFRHQQLGPLAGFHILRSNAGQYLGTLCVARTATPITGTSTDEVCLFGGQCTVKGAVYLSRELVVVATLTAVNLVLPNKLRRSDLAYESDT